MYFVCFVCFVCVCVCVCVVVVVVVVGGSLVIRLLHCAAAGARYTDAGKEF